MKIKLMNKIASVGTDVFDKSRYTIGEDVVGAEAIMVRSAALHEMAFEPELLAIARCGAGVNNIPVERCGDEGIVVFNTPGANANGVKELAILALILASRDVVGGIEWAKTLAGTPDVAKAVEKGKGAYVGHELLGKKLGVIGLGAIGGMVANAGVNLGMNVTGCDPFLSVSGAWSLSRAVHRAATFDDIYANSDYITLHVPATPDTKKMINRETIAKMRDGVRILNLARADLVDAEAIKEALASGKVAAYVTDFPTEETVNVPGIVAIPHLGASTVEAEDNCAVMAAEELVEYLECGNIRNSVNYPAVSIPHNGAARICVLHKNIPNVLNSITSYISEHGINIANLSNGSKGDNAYTIIELDEAVPAGTEEALTEINGIIRVRVL